MEELEIGLVKPNVKQLESKQTEKPNESKDEEKKIRWKYILLVFSIFLGIGAFFLAYGSVLKKQNPDAMQQTEMIEPEEVVIHVPRPQFELAGGQYSYYISVGITSEVKDRFTIRWMGHLQVSILTFMKNPLLWKKERLSFERL